MATSLAIAGVTSALRNRVAALDVGEVTLLTPADAVAAVSGTSLNLYCYRTSVNTAFANDPIPGSGRELLDPWTAPLSLDLHYCLSVHAEERPDAEYFAQVALGAAMQALHSHPCIEAAEIDAAVGAEAGYQGDVEIRVALDYLSLDELSQLWSSFRSPLAVAAFYTASVVLIDELVAQPADQMSLPGGQDVEAGVPVLGGPRLGARRTAASPGEAVQIAVRDLLPGSRLWAMEADGTIIGSVDSEIGPDDVISFAVPEAESPHASLFRPGQNLVAVGPALDSGGPDLGALSSAIGLSIAPRINTIQMQGADPEDLYLAGAVGPPDATSLDDGSALAGEAGESGVDGEDTPVKSADSFLPKDFGLDKRGPFGRPRAMAFTEDDSDQVDRVLDIGITPAVTAVQGVQLFLDQISTPSPRPHVIRASSTDGEGTVQFAIPAEVEAGSYRVRVRVGGIDSAPAFVGSEPTAITIGLQ